MGGLDGILVSANKALEDIFGYTKDEINQMGGFFEVAYPVPEERERVRKMAERSMRAQVSYVKIPMVRKDGRRIWVSVSTRTVTIRGKDHFVGIVEDITLRKQAEELSDALNRINASVIATLDPDEIMSTVVNESVKVIGSEAAGIFLREGNFWVHKHLYNFHPELLGVRLTDEEVKYAMLAVETKQPVVSNDAYHDERFDPDLMRRLSIRSFLGVPLVIHGNVIGLLFYSKLSSAIPFTAAQVDFAAKLGTLTSFALENARLYSLKREVADTMQETLLTVPAHIEGIEFSHLYRPATEVARIGGDFYDIFMLKEGKVGVSVGDISGTGVQAATLASMVKNAIRAYAFEGASPAQVMAKTNELIRGTAGPGLFVTAFFGILDTRTGRLIYCSAGHPPAILKRKPSEVALLITSSPILGAFSALNFIEDEVILGKGDVVILYTDGVTEARCKNGRFFGEEQLVRLVRSLTASTPTKEIPNVIFNTVTECAGGIVSDDIVVLSFGLANR